MNTNTKTHKPRLTLPKLLLVLAGTALFLRLLRGRNAMDFRGRVAVISGGSRGLGLAISRQLAHEGARLALLARDEAELERARKELEGLGAQVITIQCDVTHAEAAKDAIEQVVSHFGALDVLVNNAGIITVGPLEHMSDKEFEDTINLHIWAPLHLTRAAIPHMKQAGAGRVVNIASSGGKIAMPHLMPYSVSKFGQVGLSDGFRHELAKDNILVTTVCPGMIRTGSHVAAEFKGNQQAEFKIFKLAVALPGAVEASSAASWIVEAAKYGDPELIFPAPLKWAVLAQALFPNLAARVLGLIGQLLPAPVEEAEGDTVKKGHDLQASFSPVFTQLADRAVAANNELNGHAKEKTA